MQLRFASFAVINLRRDLHPQECAHAGRTKKKAARISPCGHSTNLYGKNLRRFAALKSEEARERGTEQE